MKTKTRTSDRRLIELDVSSTTILALCAECPHWYSLRLTKEEAEMEGCTHEERCHPESKDFRRRVYFAQLKRKERARERKE